MKILVSISAAALPAALVLVLAATTVHAQTLTVSEGSSFGSGFFDGGTEGSFQSNVSHSYTVVGNRHAFNLRGDVTAQMSGTADLFGFQAAAFFTVTTGAAPVELSQIRVSYYGKEVLSGGSTAEYQATNFYRGLLYAPGFGSDFEYGQYLPDRTSQGVYVTNLGEPLGGTYLAANTPYQLYIDVYPVLRLLDYPPNSSMLGYSVEFGGTVAPWFEGVTVTFEATPVPEPASLLMLGTGIAALLARRRRGG